MGNIEEARLIFSKDLYATKLSGIEIDEIGKDYAKCSMRLTENHKNGHVSGPSTPLFMRLKNQ